MEQWARPRRQVDALVLLPCGRAGTIDFGGEDRPIEWLQQVLYQKFGTQFMSNPPRLMSICGCRRHWSQLPVGTQLQCQSDLTFLALPEAYGRTKGMIPELPHRDNVIQLTPPPPKQMPQRLQEQVYGAVEQGTSRQVQKPIHGKTGQPTGPPMLRPKSELKAPPKQKPSVKAKVPPATVQMDAPRALDELAETPFPAPAPRAVGQDAQGNDGEPETPVMEEPAGSHQAAPPMEEETPMHRAHRVHGEYLTVIFGKIRVRFDVRSPCSILKVARTLVPGVLIDGHRGGAQRLHGPP